VFNVDILIFHGYLLRGTGSNVYNARLAASMSSLGARIHLFCQDHAADTLDFVDAVGDWDSGALSVRTLREPVRVTTYRPPIGRLLPVYVADRYEGFDAKRFADCTDDEIEDYVARNVMAVREVAQLAQPGVALANHLVMGPAILARALADVPYTAKIHGSALEYTVKPDRERFGPWAREGLSRARGIPV
jgi:Glycosyl transferase 4-like domain